MKNPVVVFVNKEKANNKGAQIDNLPCGWDMQGKSSQISANNYQILFLDDDQETPLLIHTNIDPNGPLFVISHVSSRHHNNPMGEENLKSVGKPILVGSFSHLSSSGILQHIIKLTCGTMTAEDFVKERRNTLLLNSFTSLAAICQIMLLDPSVDVASKLYNVFENIHPTYATMFNEKLLWNEKLFLAQDWASRLRD